MGTSYHPHVARLFPSFPSCNYTRRSYGLNCLCFHNRNSVISHPLIYIHIYMNPCKFMIDRHNLINNHICIYTHSNLENIWLPLSSPLTPSIRQSFLVLTISRIWSSKLGSGGTKANLRNRKEQVENIHVRCPST